MSHALLQLNGRWTKKAVAIARILRDEFAFTKFSGYSTADYHAKWVREKKDHDVHFENIIALPELWRQAMREPCPNFKNIARLESLYGPLQRYIIADRSLGSRLLPETVLRPCSFNRAVQRDENVALRSLELLFGFFEELFEKDKPDVLFCQVVAAAPSYVACAVAEKYKVPFLTLGKTKLDDRHHFSHSALMQPDDALSLFLDGKYTVSAETEKLFLQLSETPRPTDHYEADLGNHRKRHGGGDRRPLLKHLLAFPGTFKKILHDKKRISKGNKLPLVNPREPNHLEIWLWEWRIRKNYIMMQDRGIFSRKIPDGEFAFFPLSVTPEASTCVFAPYYSDQLVAIDACVRSLPLHWKLVVKDHLPMCGRRTLNFYKRMLDTGRVILLDPTIRSTELVNRARLTITIAGTSGWEALLQGGAVLALAPVWYLATGLAAYCPHSSLIPDGINMALELHEKTPTAERERRLSGMLQCLLEESFPFSWEMMWQNLSLEKMRASEATWRHFAKKIHDTSKSPPPFDPVRDFPWVPSEITVSASGLVLDKAPSCAGSRESLQAF
jgi:hypothetical protein